ncbi:hypothetical protein V6615_11845 [Oscillospiraceae bacterium PP1C4]
MDFWKKAGKVAENVFSWALSAIEDLPNSRTVQNFSRGQERRMEEFDHLISRMDNKSDGELIQIVKSDNGLKQVAAAKVLKDRGIL